MHVPKVSQPGADGSWDAGRDVIGALFSPRHAYHDPLLGDLPLGPAGVHRAIDAILTAMPDALVTIEDRVEEGDALVLRWSLAGTHTGPLLGMAPTGRSASMRGVHVLRFEGERITSTWAIYDALGLLDQLGLVTLGIGLGGPIVASGTGIGRG